MFNRLCRYIRNCFRGKYIRIYIVADKNSFFFWISDDIWMLIVNEWLNGVRELSALEIAIGKRNLEEGIYRIYRSVNVPCIVKVSKFSFFSSWKQSRRLTARNLVINCEYFDQIVPWNELCGVTHLKVLDTYITSFRNKVFLHDLMDLLPGIQDLTIPISCLIPPENKYCNKIDSCLKALKLYSKGWAQPWPWKPILESIPILFPLLESLQLDNVRGYTLREMLCGIANLTVLKQLSYQSKNHRDRARNIIGGDLFNTGDVEAKDIPTVSERDNSLLLAAASAHHFFPWENVTIDVYDDPRRDLIHDKILITMLSKASNLRELRLIGDITIPSSVLFDANTWKLLSIVYLHKIKISSDQLCSLIQCYAPQLTVFAAIDLTTPESDESYPWIKLLLETAVKLESLQLWQLPAEHKDVVLQQLLLPASASSSAYPNCATLRKYQLSFILSNMVLTCVLPLTNLLSPFQYLEEINIQTIESEWNTDIMDIICHACNADFIRTIKCDFGSYHEQSRLMQKQEKYQKQVETVWNAKWNMKTFPRLQTLSLECLYLTDKAVQFLLCNSPALNSINLGVQLLAKKTVIAQNADSLYCRKDVYYDYDTTLSLDTRVAIEALLSPPHFNSLFRYLLKGGVFPTIPTVTRRSRLLNEQLNEHQLFRVSVNSTSMGFLTRDMGRDHGINRRGTARQQRDNDEISDIEEEERIIENVNRVEEVFLEYVVVTEEERLALERKAVRRERVRLRLEEWNQRVAHRMSRVGRSLSIAAARVPAEWIAVDENSE